MAYACPVCGTVEADAEHLANHLAVTASLHRADHAAWLDEHAPDWADRSPSELGRNVIEHAEERDVAGHTHGADHGRDTSGRPDGVAVGGGHDARGAPDAETERVLREARELTRRSRAGDATDASPEDGDTGDDPMDDTAETEN
jgi:hypothetical protein